MTSPFEVEKRLEQSAQDSARRKVRLVWFFRRTLELFFFLNNLSIFGILLYPMFFMWGQGGEARGQFLAVAGLCWVAIHFLLIVIGLVWYDSKNQTFVTDQDRRRMRALERKWADEDEADELRWAEREAAVGNTTPGALSLHTADESGAVSLTDGQSSAGQLSPVEPPENA